MLRLNFQQNVIFLICRYRFAFYLRYLSILINNADPQHLDLGTESGLDQAVSKLTKKVLTLGLKIVVHFWLSHHMIRLKSKFLTL